MVIKVLGGGCANCIALYNSCITALEELGIEAEVLKVQDFAEITEYNVMSTPALVINEKVVGYGKLKYNKVKDLIKENE